MSDNDLMGFLMIGLIFVVADGQVLPRGGRRYLRGGRTVAKRQGRWRGWW
ncbi:hypothetical protein [Amycolatopsis sp. NPDC051372]